MDFGRGFVEPVRLLLWLHVRERNPGGTSVREAYCA